MLLRLSDHIRVCYGRAQKCEERAAAEPAQRSSHLEIAQRWVLLARSYEFAESLERFLLEIDRSGAEKRLADQMDWQPVATAPFDLDLRLAVVDQDCVAHALVFPCRRVLGSWLKAETKARIDVDPTHWQEWKG
jgi:hypothetical protein